MATAHIALVIAPVYVAASSAPSLWTLALFLWFGLLAHGLTNLLHEASHNLVFRRRAWNEFLGHWVLGPLFLSEFAEYRHRHRLHHKDFGTAQDTKSAYLTDLRGEKGTRFLVLTLLGYEAIKKFRMSRASATSRMMRTGDPPFIAAFILFQAVFAGSLALVAFWSAQGVWTSAVIRFAVAYGVVYLYAMATVTIIIATLRAICEHQLLSRSVTTDDRAALRNLRTDPVSRLLFGNYGFATHATHHYYPAIPCYNLPIATQAMAVDHPELIQRDSYWTVLLRARRDVDCPPSAH